MQLQRPKTDLMNYDPTQKHLIRHVTNVIKFDSNELLQETLKKHEKSLVITHTVLFCQTFQKIFLQSGTYYALRKPP